MEAGGDQHRELCQVFELKEAHEMNQRIIKQGEPGDCLYIIIQGKVRFEIETKGESLNVGVRSSGMAFGELAILTADARAASALVEEMPCSLISVHRNDYKKALLNVYGREIESRVSFLKNIHIFRGWSKERLEDFAQVLGEKKFTTNQIILKQGERSTSMYFIRQGKVSLLYNCSSAQLGKNQVLEIGQVCIFHPS
jgi:CRP-like cAMP-binding protein